MDIKVNFDFCYQSNPCCHYVTIIDENGVKKQCQMRAPEIVDLIVKNKIIVSAKNFKHFQYCFTSSDQSDYLKELENKRNKNNANLFCDSDGYNIHTLFHGEPIITNTAKVFRTSTIDLPHIIQLEKINNSFMLDYTLLKTKISNEHYFLNQICCIKNDKIYYPNNLKIKYQGIELDFYGKCMKDFMYTHKELFYYPLYLDNNLEVIVDEDVDSIYCKIFSISSKGKGGSGNRYNQYWEKSSIIAYYHEIINDFSTINGYYSKLYISANNFNNLKAISVSNNKHIFVDNVNISIFKIEDDLLVIPLNCNNEKFGMHINANDNFKITYHLKDNSIEESYTIYGEKVGKIESA